jgi:hypothetical protein
MPHVEPVAAKIIDLITFERRSRNLRLEMRTSAPRESQRVFARAFSIQLKLKRYDLFTTAIL